MASILWRALRLCGCARRHGIAHASSVKCVPPQQGEHCQSCSSAVTARFLRAQALWRVESYFGDAREAFCCRVADARSNKAGLSSCGKPRIRESPGTKKGRGRAREVPSRLLPFLAPSFGRRHLQNARGLKPAKRLYAPYKRSGAREARTAPQTVPFPRLCNETQRFPATNRASSTNTHSGAAGWSRTPSTPRH